MCTGPKASKGFHLKHLNRRCTLSAWQSQTTATATKPGRCRRHASTLPAAVPPPPHSTPPQATAPLPESSSSTSSASPPLAAPPPAPPCRRWRSSLSCAPPGGAPPGISLPLGIDCSSFSFPVTSVNGSPARHASPPWCHERTSTLRPHHRDGAAPPVALLERGPATAAH